MMHNPIIGYETVKVKDIPFSVFDKIYEDDGESETLKSAAILSDNGFASDESYGNRECELYLNSLTKRQREVAMLLQRGLKRDEMADELGVCTQAIHQIILRIRKRLAQKAGVSTKGWKSRHEKF